MLKKNTVYDPTVCYVGGFSPQDGTLDFYNRINSILNPNMTILDFGAGRAEWYTDDPCI